MRTVVFLALALVPIGVLATSMDEPQQSKSKAGSETTAEAAPPSFPAGVPFVPGARPFDSAETKRVMRVWNDPNTSFELFEYDTAPTLLAMKYRAAFESAGWDVDLAPTQDPVSPAVKYRLAAKQRKRKVALSFFQAGAGTLLYVTVVHQ